MSDNIRHQAVHADNLPKPAGPYSPGTTLDGLIFVSGQGANDPRTGEIVGHDIESQTEQVLRNVDAILRAAGSDLAHVLRCNVYLVDIAEFSRMNAVYSRIFGSNRPARTTVQVSALPGPGLRVEIDAIAYKK